jgi:hypothetical protein
MGYNKREWIAVRMRQGFTEDAAEDAWTDIRAKNDKLPGRYEPGRDAGRLPRRCFYSVAKCASMGVTYTRPGRGFTEEEIKAQLESFVTADGAKEHRFFIPATQVLKKLKEYKKEQERLGLDFLVYVFISNDDR